MFHHAAIGLVVQLTSRNDEVLCFMLMMCTREFLFGRESLHVEEEKPVHHELLINMETTHQRD